MIFLDISASNAFFTCAWFLSFSPLGSSQCTGIVYFLSFQRFVSMITPGLIDCPNKSSCSISICRYIIRFSYNVKSYFAVVKMYDCNTSLFFITAILLDVYLVLKNSYFKFFGKDINKKRVTQEKHVLY